VVLVVSEETGQIALVRNGEVFRNLSSADLRLKLNQFLFDTDQKPAISPVDQTISTV